MDAEQQEELNKENKNAGGFLFGEQAKNMKVKRNKSKYVAMRCEVMHCDIFVLCHGINVQPKLNR